MANAFDSADMKQEQARHAGSHLDRSSIDAGNPDLASIAKLRTELETVPAVSIEQAAELLELSVRTLYRRRAQFEHRRRKGHLYFTLRGIKQHIEIEQYNPTPSFDITNLDVFDSFDRRSVDTRLRRTQGGGSATTERPAARWSR
jgi:hypothetical protein